MDLYDMLHMLMSGHLTLGVETDGEVVSTWKEQEFSGEPQHGRETVLRGRKRPLQPTNYTLAKAYYKQVISIGTFVGLANDINVFCDDLQSYRGPETQFVLMQLPVWWSLGNSVDVWNLFAIYL